MKISVDLSEKDLKEIQLYSGEKRKGAAIKKMALDHLRLQKRRALCEKAMSGKLSVDFLPLVGKGTDRSSWLR